MTEGMEVGDRLDARDQDGTSNTTKDVGTCDRVAGPTRRELIRVSDSPCPPLEVASGLDRGRPRETRPPPAGAPASASPPARTEAHARAALGPRRGFLRIGLASSTFGLCLLLFGLYVYPFSALQEHRDQRQLLNAFTLPTKARILSKHSPPDGQPGGVLTIPAIDLTQVLVEGTSSTDLLKGPGLMPGTARPGSLGNTVIAGHRTIAGSPFAELDRLRVGDDVEVVTNLGRYRYRVSAVGVVRPGSLDPTSPDRHPVLTLVTSAGMGRLFVRARLISTPNQARVPRHPPNATERGVAGDPAAVLPSVTWGLVLLAGFALTFAAYWRFRGRHWGVYLLSTPTLLAAALMWYENLIRLLPGTM